MNLFSYPGPEDESVDVAGEHGRRTEDGRVGRRHGSSRDGAQTAERDVGRRQVLQDHW